MGDAVEAKKRNHKRGHGVVELCNVMRHHVIFLTPIDGGRGAAPEPMLLLLQTTASFHHAHNKTHNKAHNKAHRAHEQPGGRARETRTKKGDQGTGEVK